MTRGTIMAAMTAGTMLMVAPVWSGHAPRVIWNASASVPIGLYRIDPADRIAVTDLVIVMPPEPLASFLDERGYLPRGVPLLKRVLALGGQTVCRNGPDIIAYDARYGAARAHDTRGRPLPVWQGCRVITENAVFLMNWDAPDSFDSRYVGPLPLASIIGRAVPIWTRDDADNPEPAPLHPGHDGSFPPP